MAIAMSPVMLGGNGASADPPAKWGVSFGWGWGDQLVPTYSNHIQSHLLLNHIPRYTPWPREESISDSSGGGRSNWSSSGWWLGWRTSSMAMSTRAAPTQCKPCEPCVEATRLGCLWMFMMDAAGVGWGGRQPSWSSCYCTLIHMSDAKLVALCCAMVQWYEWLIVTWYNQICYYMFMTNIYIYCNIAAISQNRAVCELCFVRL